MVGHEEEQLPRHPLCWLFLTVCMKLRGVFFPLPVLVTKVTTNNSGLHTMQITMKSWWLSLFRKFTLPCSSQHMFLHMEFFTLLCWKQWTLGWVRSTLVLPLLCPGRSGLQDWSQKPLSWFLTDRAPSLPGALTCLPGALTCLPVACWTHSAMTFFFQFSTGQLLRLPVHLASVLLAAARQTLSCSSPLQCAFKKKKLLFATFVY